MLAHHAQQVILILGALCMALMAIGKVFGAVGKASHLYEVVVKELTPNGGSSIRDAITRIDDRLNAVESAVALIGRVAQQQDGSRA